MAYVYINQRIDLYADTETGLATAVTLQIRYKMPDGTIGYLDATETATAGEIHGFLAGSQNVMVGDWEFRAWPIFSNDPNPVPGVPFIQHVGAID